MARKSKTGVHVTWGKWSVSCETSSMRPGVVKLSVFKFYDNLRNSLGGKGRIVYGDHNGKKFATTEEAFAFALDRGYSQTYFTAPDLRARRKAQARDPRALRTA